MVVMWSIRSIKKEGGNKLKKRLGGAILLTLVFFVIALVTQLPNEFFRISQKQKHGKISAMQASGTLTWNRSACYGRNVVTDRLDASVVITNYFCSDPVIIGYFRWFLSNSHEAGTPRLSSCSILSDGNL
jgi:hypothetical protein